MRRADRARWSGGVWWLSPVGALALVVPLPLLVADRLDDAEYRLQWNTPKSLTSSTVLLVSAAAMVLVLASVLVQLPGRRRRPVSWPGVDDAGAAVLERAATVLFWLTSFGYAAFLAVAVGRGASFSSVWNSIVQQDNYSSTFEAQFAPVGGVTTFTQFGIAYVVVAGVLLTRGPPRPPRVARRLVIVLLLSLVRAFVSTERLALLELLVPLVAVVAMAWRGHRSGTRRFAAVWAPAVFVPLLFTVFGAFEYSRSWQFFKVRTEQSFPEFVVTRVAGYYVTAHNNGQLRLDYERYPGRVPFESVQLFWDAPGVGELGLYDRLSAAPPPSATFVLEQYGNPEFNNPGGLMVPFVDFGTVGGFVFFAVAGLVLGLLYRSFLDARPVGMLLYPVAVTGVFELPRYIYWSGGRILPAVVALLVVARQLHRSAPPGHEGSPDARATPPVAVDGHPRARGRTGRGDRALHDRAGGVPARSG